MAVWDALEGETIRQYQLFKLYLMQGANRSHRKVAEQAGIQVDRVNYVSVKNSWLKRILAYEEYLTDKFVEGQVDLMSVVKDRVLQDALEDYEDMLQAWRENWNSMLIDPEGFSPTRMKSLFESRKILDDFARRAVYLPHVIKQDDQTNQKQLPSNAPMLISGTVAPKRYDKPVSEDSFDEDFDE